MSSAITERPGRDAAATLAREPGDTADLEHARAFADRAMARATASVLHAQALAAAMIRAADDAFPTDARGRAIRRRSAPDSRAQLSTRHNYGIPGGSPRCGT